MITNYYDLLFIAFNTGIEPLTWQAVPSQTFISYFPFGSSENMIKILKNLKLKVRIVIEYNYALSSL